MQYKYYRLGLLIICAINLFLSSNNLFAESLEEVARLYSKKGSVEGKLAPDKAWKEIDTGTIFKASDAVKAGKHGRAGILFADGVFVRISNNASIKFKAPQKDTTRPIGLDNGKAHFFSRAPKRHPRINTPTVSASIRGTEFVVEVADNKTTISMIDGVVECENAHGTISVGKGEQVIAEAGKAPVKSILINPFDAVQWALNYPSIVSLDDYADFEPGANEIQKAAWNALKQDNLGITSRLFKGKDWRDILGRSITALKQGQLENAINIIESYKGKPSTSLFLYKSTLNLSSGQIEAANANLEQMLSSIAKAPAEAQNKLSAAYYAQKAIIALTQNQKDKAQTFTEEALKANSDSLSALLSLSFLKQAQFDLVQAKDALEKAILLYPNAAYPHARLAELELGFGDVKKASELAERSITLEYNNAYANAVMGFVALFKNQDELAAKFFESALALDSNAAVARFGLGLLQIKDGNLAEGRLELQKAIHLEPNRAIYRSYLGKAYFEEEDEDLAAKEYELAIELDPKDPTPYLYRGFNELSQNRPVAALADVEKSIELNNNRAVYRSSQLLDQDLGMRSAGLAQVFNTLGFSEAARIEAIKSINSDYSNYSAHRLLSESQSAVYIADASFSERRIADLLAPLSFNMFNSPGGEASLNEYSALFDKSEQRTGFNFTYDSADDIFAEEVFHTGKFEDYGYFMGLSADLRDGRDSNDFYRDYRLRLAGQYQFTYQDRLVFETSAQFQDVNNSHASFEDTEFLAYDFALAYHRKISPSTSFMMQTIVARNVSDAWGYDNREIDIIEKSLGAVEVFTDELFLEERKDEDELSFRTGGQFVYNSDLVSGVAGYQLLNTEADRTENSLIHNDYYGLFNDLDRRLKSVADNAVNGSDVYLYSTWHLQQWLDLSLGFSHTKVETEKSEFSPFIDGELEQNRVNPKFGLTLYPTANLTLRSAYFESLRKTTFEDQAGLEPTLVGGINQRFNDMPGTQSRNYAVGADYKIPNCTYFGGEWTHRNLKEYEALVSDYYYLDFDALAENQTTRVDAIYDEHLEQDIARAYLYQILHDNFTATVDYQFSLEDRSDPEVNQEIQTHKTAFTLRYFDPSGLFAYGRGTWRQQDRLNSFYFEDGISDFWVYDAGLGYRIPKRHGTVTLHVLNLGDEDFVYDQALGYESFIKPELTVRLVASVNF